MKYVLFLSLMFLVLCEDAPDDNIGCTEQFVYGLIITVKDANINDILVEDVTVIIQDGEYQEELMNIQGTNDFIGAGERPGNYTIKVTADGYESYTTEAIQINANECHVIPEALEILLETN